MHIRDSAESALTIISFDSTLTGRAVCPFKGRWNMANTKSAKKAARQAERRTLVNKSRRSRMRTFVRKVEEAIASGDRDAANVALREAQPEIMRSASKGILHKNTASRKISRLSARIKAIGAAA
jgi:small subunit ribosomal protein S20